MFYNNTFAYIATILIARGMKVYLLFVDKMKSLGTKQAVEFSSKIFVPK
jgi:hypothetical protein